MNAYKNISTYIQTLLFEHDCVIVPQFGGFVARMQPAGFSTGNHILHPPTKTILFNKNLQHNDGLLATAVMEQERLEYAQANTLIQDFVNYCNGILHTKKRLELDKLGLFYLDAENVIQFEPRVDVNFLIEAYGFTPIATTEFIEEKKVAQSLVEFVDRPALQENRSVKTNKRYRRVAAIAAAIPLIAGLFYTAAHVGPTKQLWQSSVNPFYVADPTYTPINYTHTSHTVRLENSPELITNSEGYAVFKLNETSTSRFVANISDTAQVDKTLVAAAIHEINYSKKTTLGGRYQVVVGCFGVKNNALRLVEELQHNQIQAGISGQNKNGLHVVSCGGFNTKAEADVLVSNIRQRYPNAWVMGQ